MTRSTLARWALVLLLVAAVLSGCTPNLTHGLVVKKWHEPETTFIMFIPLMMSCGKDCSYMILVPYWVRDDEDWIVVIEGTVIEGRDRGKTVKRRLYVTRYVYESVEVGDYYRVHKSDQVTDDHQRLEKARNT